MTEKERLLQSVGLLDPTRVKTVSKSKATLTPAVAAQIRAKAVKVLGK